MFKELFPNARHCKEGQYMLKSITSLLLWKYWPCQTQRHLLYEVIPLCADACFALVVRYKYGSYTLVLTNLDMQSASQLCSFKGVNFHRIRKLLLTYYLPDTHIHTQSHKLSMSQIGECHKFRMPSMKFLLQFVFELCC